MEPEHGVNDERLGIAYDRSFVYNRVLGRFTAPKTNPVRHCRRGFRISPLSETTAETGTRKAARISRPSSQTRRTARYPARAIAGARAQQAAEVGTLSLFPCTRPRATFRGSLPDHREHLWQLTLRATSPR